MGFGVALGVMNWAIYQAFARIPLGVAVTIEFVGPLAHRGRRLATCRATCSGWRWPGAGVLLLGLQPGDVTLAGAGFALLAGGAWAAYILLSAQHRRPLARASTGSPSPASWPPCCSPRSRSAVRARPWSTRGSWRVGAAVGLLSSVIPYSCEMVALRRLRPAVFSILMSLEPAAAALAAIVVLGEFLTRTQWLAMACVVVASVGATRSGRALAEPVPD